MHTYTLGLRTALLSLGLLMGCPLFNGPQRGTHGSEVDAGHERNPCDATRCKSGTHCEAVVVQCIQAPCDPVAQCLADAPSTSCATTQCAKDTYCDDISGAAKCLPLPSCNTVKCSAGNECQLIHVQCIRAPCPPQPSCVPVLVENPCTLVDCQPNLICQVVDGKAQCVGKEPCAAVACKDGSHCELVPVKCKRAPCNPVTECVLDQPDPCALVRCKAGTHCESVQVECITTPCNPVAECLPDAPKS
jgi:hypothetical protein